MTGRRVFAFVAHHPWLSMTALVVVLAMAGVTVTALGLIPIKASSGHWHVTEQVLQFVKRRSVSTHARLVGSPPEGMDDRRLLVRGAGHYETSCRNCHAAPGDRLPAVPAAMTPHPPDLLSTIPSWNTRELFYIVRHGIKFTGMPAWAADQRDDEVWAVVAFLEVLPSMSPAEYTALVRGPDWPLGAAAVHTTAPDVVVQQCARCHGLDGTGDRTSAFPKIGGQRLGYLRRALRAYALGDRHSGFMEPVASRIGAAARERAARYYADLPPAEPIGGLDPAAVARGEILVRQGDPARSIPACADCHLPGGERVNTGYPSLAGQHPDYLVQQLRLFQARARGGSEHARLMLEFVDELEPSEMRDAAAFLAAQSGAD